MMRHKFNWNIDMNIDVTKIVVLIILIAWTTFGNLSIDYAILILIEALSR